MLIFCLEIMSIVLLLVYLLLIIHLQVAIRNIRRDALKAYEKLEKV